MKGQFRISKVIHYDQILFHFEIFIIFQILLIKITKYRPFIEGLKVFKINGKYSNGKKINYFYINGEISNFNKVIIKLFDFQN